MMPFVYEIKRVLTSRTVLVITAITLLLSGTAAIGNVVSSEPPGPSSQVNAYNYGYGANGTYHVVVRAFNGYGQGLQGKNVTVTLGDGQVLSALTNPEGFANITIANLSLSKIGSYPPQSNEPAYGSNYVMVKFSLDAMYSGGGIRESGYTPIAINQTNPYYYVGTYNSSRFALDPVSPVSQPSRSNLGIYYEGSPSQVSPEIRLYYMPLNTTNDPQIVKYFNLNESKLTYFGSYSGFHQETVNLQNLTSSNTSTYLMYIFSPSGNQLSIVQVTTFMPYSTGYVNAQFFSNEMSVLDLFVPLMAIMSAYMTFGKDKTSLVLDSVLARPVTRKSIITSRYLSGTLSIFGASAASFGIVTLMYSYYLGTGLPAGTILVALFSLLVSASAFTGLVYLTSCLVKSQNALLGISLAFFFVFDIMWTSLIAPIIPYVYSLVLLGNAEGTIAYARGFLSSYYLTPSGYSGIANVLVTGHTDIYISAAHYTASQLGMSPIWYVIGGILWIVVPTMLAVLVFDRKD